MVAIQHDSSCDDSPIVYHSAKLHRLPSSNYLKLLEGQNMNQEPSQVIKLDDYAWSDFIGDLPPDAVVTFIVLVLVAFLVVRIIFR